MPYVILQHRALKVVPKDLQKQVVDWIRERLPEDARWLRFEHKVAAQIVWRIKREEST